MDLITRITNLAYHQERDTFIVGPRDIIHSSFDVRRQELYTLKNMDAATVRSLLAPTFPDLIIQEDGLSNKIVISGLPHDVRKALEIIEVFDKEKRVEEKALLVQPLLYADPDIVLEALGFFFPDVGFYYERSTESLIIEGAQEKILRAQEMVVGLDREPREVEEVEEELVVEVVPLDYADINETRAILSSIFPDLQVELYEKKDRFILKGALDTIEIAKELIQRIDEQKSQVLIEVQIEDISLTAREELGLPDFSDISFISFEEGGIKAEFPSIIRLLQEEGASETLARPRLTAVHGEEARLLIGDQIPYLIRGRQMTEDGWETEERIEYMDAGILLEFLPRITEDNIITLRISTEISSFEDIGRELPQTSTRRAETTIRLKDGESIIIGGLIRDTETENLSKVPFLGELPLLGHLFQRLTKSMDKNEIIIILTTHIIDKKVNLLEDLQNH